MQLVGRVKPVGTGIGVGQLGQLDFVDGDQADVADTGDVAPLAGPHAAMRPQADGLCLRVVKKAF